MKGLHVKVFVVDIGSIGRSFVVDIGSMENKKCNSTIKNGIGSPSLGIFNVIKLP